jgi:hypothetical protein
MKEEDRIAVPEFTVCDAPPEDGLALLITRICHGSILTTS